MKNLSSSQKLRIMQYMSEKFIRPNKAVFTDSAFLPQDHAILQNRQDSKRQTIAQFDEANTPIRIIAQQIEADKAKGTFQESPTRKHPELLIYQEDAIKRHIKALIDRKLTIYIYDGTGYSIVPNNLTELERSQLPPGQMLDLVNAEHFVGNLHLAVDIISTDREIKIVLQ